MKTVFGLPGVVGIVGMVGGGGVVGGTGIGQQGLLSKKSLAFAATLSNRLGDRSIYLINNQCKMCEDILFELKLCVAIKI